MMRKLLVFLVGLLVGLNAAYGQTARVTGTVRGAEDGMPIPGVSVIVKGTTMGTATDTDGSYALSVPLDAQMLVFSYIGYATQEVAIAGRTVIDVELVQSAESIEEVIVTGYQTISRERATGAYALVQPADVSGKLEPNIVARIEGQVAGINRDNQGNLLIRGQSTIYGNAQPLYVVDGMPYEGDVTSINPAEVQSITVLKDAAAASIYGARSANGVIVITTQRGKSGQMRVNYSNSLKITPLPNFDYLNLMSSTELVDVQREGFAYKHTDASFWVSRPDYYLNPVLQLLYDHEAGTITDAELDAELAVYRAADNRQQIRDALGRTGLQHWHSLSLSGGSELNRYFASVSYTGDNPNQRDANSRSLGFNIKDDIQINRFLQADFGVAGNFDRSSRDVGIGSMRSLYTAYPSYLMLRDSQGNALPLPASGKSDWELERLRSLGLADETYSPITNRGRELNTNQTNYYRLQAGLRLNVLEGLTLDARYQTELSNSTERTVYGREAYSVRRMVNDAAVVNYDNSLTFNVPYGGQLSEGLYNTYSYTLRAQATYSRAFAEQHSITALIGAERRLVRTKGTTAYYMGYDDDGLVYTPADLFALADGIYGTESLSGYFSWLYSDHNYLTDIENRYVSFYGNAAYTFADRYNITASIRMDQSNLFGTDPRYQYRPLWSVGAGWVLSNEAFMQNAGWLNHLALRFTYGIGGNCPKGVGPYLVVSNDGYQSLTRQFGYSIVYPPNPSLRWEKTASLNAGIDFDLLGSRLGGSIDFYQKNTTDLLALRNSDPTLGFSQRMLNYGSMTNSGLEIALRATAIQRDNLTLGAHLMFSYNRNRLTNVEGSEETVFQYTAYNVQAVGKPMNSLFSYRYAGLSPTDGSPQVYNAQNVAVPNVTNISELVYSGTRDPKYTASLRPFASAFGFDLSLLFVYYGGHVMRDEVAPILGGAPSANISRKFLNHWRQPGDEAIAGMAPAFSETLAQNYDNAQVWYAADAHVKRADYIRLRDISLTYNLPSSLLASVGVANASITAQVSNVWWWAANGDIDPEAYTTVGYGYGARDLPNPTTCTLGLQLNF